MLINFARHAVPPLRKLTPSIKGNFDCWTHRVTHDTVAWFWRRKDHAQLVQANADRLIARFGDQAYFEARNRAQRSVLIDANRPKGHWTRVKLEIAKGTELKLGRAELTNANDFL